MLEAWFSPSAKSRPLFPVSIPPSSSYPTRAALGTVRHSEHQGCTGCPTCADVPGLRGRKGDPTDSTPPQGGRESWEKGPWEETPLLRMALVADHHVWVHKSCSLAAGSPPEKTQNTQQNKTKLSADTPRIIGFEILKKYRLSARKQRSLHHRPQSLSTAWSPQVTGSKDVRPGTWKANGLISNCPLLNKSLHISAALLSIVKMQLWERHWSSWESWKGTMLPWGRCQGRQCRAALHTHRDTAGPGSQGGATPGKRDFEMSKTLPRSEGKGEKHACEREEGEEAPLSPWRAHLEQWDRICEETHTEDEHEEQEREKIQPPCGSRDGKQDQAQEQKSETKTGRKAEGRKRRYCHDFPLLLTMPTYFNWQLVIFPTWSLVLPVKVIAKWSPRLYLAPQAFPPYFPPLFCWGGGVKEPLDGCLRPAKVNSLKNGRSCGTWVSVFRTVSLFP